MNHLGIVVVLFGPAAAILIGLIALIVAFAVSEYKANRRSRRS
jgi:hypothetical protein